MNADVTVDSRLIKLPYPGLCLPQQLHTAYSGAPELRNSAIGVAPVPTKPWALPQMTSFNGSGSPTPTSAAPSAAASDSFLLRRFNSKRPTEKKPTRSRTSNNLSTSSSSQRPPAILCPSPLFATPSPTLFPLHSSGGSDSKETSPPPPTNVSTSQASTPVPILKRPWERSSSTEQRLDRCAQGLLASLNDSGRGEYYPSVETPCNSPTGKIPRLQPAEDVITQSLFTVTGGRLERTFSDTDSADDEF